MTLNVNSGRANNNGVYADNWKLFCCVGMFDCILIPFEDLGFSRGVGMSMGIEMQIRQDVSVLVG